MNIQLSEASFRHEILDHELAVLMAQTERAQKGPRREMYNIDKRDFTSWGLPGYEIIKKYVDTSAKQEEGKPSLTKTKNKHSSRSSFLEYVQKIAANKPGPGEYKIPSQFAPSNDKDRKLRVLARNSFIDQIERNSKLRSVPGPGTYFQKTRKEEEAEIATMKRNKKGSIFEKIIFLDESQVKSDSMPGPGNYNAHLIRTPLHLARYTPKQQLTADKEYESFKKKLQETYCSPTMRTYSPEPTSFLTFSKIQQQRDQAAKEGTKENKAYFGKEQRFPETTKTKSNMFVNVPGPGHYDTRVQWKGKVDPKAKEDKRSINWQKLSNGVQLSIYYEK